MAKYEQIQLVRTSTYLYRTDYLHPVRKELDKYIYSQGLHPKTVLECELSKEAIELIKFVNEKIYKNEIPIRRKGKR